MDTDYKKIADAFVLAIVGSVSQGVISKDQGMALLTKVSEIVVDPVLAPMVKELFDIAAAMGEPTAV